MIPVSLSGGVEPGARTGTSLGGQEVVIWRGEDGSARAWADRCPHRGLRLSFGYVRDNALTCLYHAWSFDQAPDGTAGQCRAVPQATVPGFPVAEALGLIWVGAGPGDTQLPPGLPRDAGAVYPVRSITVHAPPAALLAALEAAPPPGAETAEATQAAGGGIVTFKGTLALVVAAIQDRGDGAASAHVVTTEADPAVRQGLCRWAALIRDHLAAVVLP
jgi:nitrite reductase/ring-hydroxylating ferredoxin subunit